MRFVFLLLLLFFLFFFLLFIGVGVVSEFKDNNTFGEKIILFCYTAYLFFPFCYFFIFRLCLYSLLCL